MNEEWRSIPDASKYEVSNFGRVRRGGKILSASGGDKYRMLTLCVDGKRMPRVVHQLVLEAFVGPRPSVEHEANHRDGNKANNRLDNLEWITSSENKVHAFRLRLAHSGERHAAAKFSDAQVAEMKALYASGQYTQKEIAARFGTIQCYISALMTGRLRRHDHLAAVLDKKPG